MDTQAALKITPEGQNLPGAVVTFSHSKFLEVGRQALVSAMQLVRARQIDSRFDKSLATKADDTLLTVTDGDSAKILHQHLSTAFPDAFFDVEDFAGAGQSIPASQVIFLVDPLDGTRAFSIGLPTSTIVIAALDPQSHKVIACMVGEPISGRIMYSTGSGTFLEITDKDGAIQTFGCKVSETAWGKGSTLLIDHSKGFQRSGRTVLTNPQAHALFTALASEASILIPGSNALHQWLVAQGRGTLIGGVTTAIGGSWDVAGALLVKQAGGSAVGLKIHKNQLVICDALQVLDYDILAYGNSQQTVERLIENVRALIPKNAD